MRKIWMILLLSLFALSSASAKPELWLGASFKADRNTVSSEISGSFPAMGISISEIKSIGLDADIVFFPSDAVRIGVIGGYNMMLPIGRTEKGGANEGYVTYDFENRQDLSVGLAYYQFFTPQLGAFLTFSFEWSWYKTAMEHLANDSRPMDFVYETDYGLLGEIGILSRQGNMYFRLGFTFAYDLKHINASGYKMSLIAGGGILI